MKIQLDNINELAWDKMSGLIPCIAQDHRTGRVLMQGYVNNEALKASLQSGHLTFFSRSKERLWVKGETSGNTLNLIEMVADCDKDAILVQVTPKGPTCHLGTETCWDGSTQPALSFLGHLQNVIEQRKGEDPDKSYTAKLMNSGIKRMAQKVGEEGVEVALAATVKDKEELLNESADLLYHLSVLLQASDTSLEEVCDTLSKRHK